MKICIGKVAIYVYCCNIIVRKLTELPHLAGSDNSRDLAMDIYKEWLNYSFDSVEVVNYTVLLSYPDQDNPNSLKLKDSGGAVLYDSKIAEEPPLTEDEKKPNVVAPFNAYSGHGTVTVCNLLKPNCSFLASKLLGI